MAQPARAPDAAAPMPTARSRAMAVWHFFVGTLAGRLILAGGGIKAACFGIDAAGVDTIGVVRFVSPVGGLALAVGLGIVIYRLGQSARRNLLWRVRRKLIISYVFIGVVPVILVAAFFLLAGLLLFTNLSSYLIRASLREMAADAQTISRTTALAVAGTSMSAAEVGLAERFDELRRRYHGLSVAVVPTLPGRCPSPGTRNVPAGAPPPATEMLVGWRHQDPPAIIPAWVTCAGFANVVAFETAGGAAGGDVGVTVRAVTQLAGRAVVVDLPLDAEVRQRIHDVTGVTLGRFSLGADDAAPVTPAGDGSAAPAPSEPVSRVQWVALLDHTNWATGAVEALPVQIGLNVREVYRRLSASQALLGTRNYGDLLVGALMLVAVLFLIIQVGALAMGFALARSITGSIHELFVGTERVRAGDFGHRIAVRVKDQLGQLADSFNLMTGSIEDLLRQAAEKKRLEEEMRLAREIQTSLLPPGPLQVPGMGVTAVCVPAREVGGDYYDVLPLDGGRVGVLIADVSGKGMSAALYMAELKGLMLSLTRIHASPRDLLISANRLIAEHLDSRSFITMTYAVIDPVSLTMTYARAGHTPLIFVPHHDDGEARAQILVPDGMVVGLRIDNGERFEAILQEATLRLAPGDLLAFFTDGISEAMNAESDCFGEPRLAQLLESHAHLPFDQLRERVLREIDAFVGDAPQHDDMTMILLKVNHDACPNP
jgi:sigma-B regulation protein RsbU (phosphoserine phosphatase)